jgi:hypothetical protein
MLTLLRRSFPHRHNADGSYDSICTVCFATVATVENECELPSHESAHVCRPLDHYPAHSKSVATIKAGVVAMPEGQR